MPPIFSSVPAGFISSRTPGYGRHRGRPFSVLNSLDSCLHRNDGLYRQKLPACSMIWVASINKKDYESSIQSSDQKPDNRFLKSEVGIRKSERLEDRLWKSEVGMRMSERLEDRFLKSEVGTIGEQLSDNRYSGFKPPWSRHLALPYALCFRPYAQEPVTRIP